MIIYQSRGWQEVASALEAHGMVSFLEVGRVAFRSRMCRQTGAQ